MKLSACEINRAREELIDRAALKTTLKNGTGKLMVLEVDTRPAEGTSPDLDNVPMTPHRNPLHRVI